MKRFVMTIALACVLSSSALAGEIPISGAPSPQPSGTNQTTSEASPGEIPCGFAEEISEAGLSGLLTVLSLLGV
jgi:hypothetical protein